MKVSKNIFNKKNTIFNIKDFQKENKTKKKKYNFSFYVRSKEYKTKTIFILYGKHYSKNVINTWNRWIKQKYKKAIHESFHIHNKQKKLKKYDKVSIKYIVCNPRSRDDDANYETLKFVRDAIVNINVINDDNRNIVLKTTEKEKITKNYKIFIILTKES